jgi:hypothetical protein
MHHVATLAEAPEVAETVIGRVVVEVSRGKDNPGHADLDGIDQVRPAGQATTPVTPRVRGWIKPPPVGQASDLGEMWAAAILTATAGAFESNTSTEFTPVGRIKC